MAYTNPFPSDASGMAPESQSRIKKEVNGKEPPGFGRPLPLVLTQSEGLTSGSAVDSAEDFLDCGLLEAVYSLTLYSVVFVSPTPPDFFFPFFFFSHLQLLPK